MHRRPSPMYLPLALAFTLLSLLLLLLVPVPATAQDEGKSPEEVLAAAVKNRMDRGMKQYKARDWKKAEREFAKAVALDGGHAPAHLYRGYCRYQQRDYAAAVESYTAAIDADPDRAGTGYYARGQAHSLLKRYEKALADFSKAVELHPNWGAAYHYRGNALYQLDRFAPAMQDYDRAVEHQRNNWAAWMQRAKVSEAMGDFEAAETVYSALIEANPSYAKAYSARGRCRALLGKRAAAELDFARAIREKPKDPVPLCVRARLRMLFNDGDRALEDCDAAWKIDKTHHYPYYIRGLVKYNFGKFRPARADFRKAIKKMMAKGQEPDYIQLYLCLVQRRIGKHEEAIRDLKAYFAAKKKKPDDWYVKIVKFLTNEIDEATFLKAADAESPKRTRELQCEAYFYAGTYRLVAGDENKAFEYFRKVVKTGVIDFIEYETSKIALARPS